MGIYRVAMTSGTSRLATTSASMQWTAASVQLLDLTFEPATPLAAEIFDRVCEHTAAALQSADLAARLGRPFVPAYLSFPAATTAGRRANANQLRSTVLAGRLPGNRPSQRKTSQTLAHIAMTVRAAGAPEVICDTLDVLSQATKQYWQAGTRLRELCAQGSLDLATCAEQAARVERTFLSTMDRVVAHLKAQATSAIG